jgi:hypothetical protein
LIVLPGWVGASLQLVQLVVVLEGRQLVREAASLSMLHSKSQRLVVQEVVRKWVVAEVGQKVAPLVVRILEELVV